MAVEIFIYADNPFNEIAAGASVNFLVVAANSRKDADAIIAQRTTNSMLTNYPQAAGVVQKKEWQDPAFNKIVAHADFSALGKGVGAPGNAPGVLYEFQVAAHA